MVVISQQLLHKSQYSTTHKTSQKLRTSQIKYKNLEAKKQKNTQLVLQIHKLKKNLTNCEAQFVTIFFKSLKMKKTKACKCKTKMTMTKRKKKKKKKKTFYVTRK